MAHADPAKEVRAPYTFEERTVMGHAN